MGTLLLDPIAFSIGGLKVHWYGLILGSAALIGLLLAVWEGKRFRIPQEFFMDLLLLGVPSAIIAARIYYVAFMWDDYKNNFWDVFKIWNGGIAIYGALIGAIICAVIFVRRRGYNFWRIADICAPSLIIGQMIGRWGNFVNQEAYGGPTTESFLRENLHLPSFIVNQMNVQGTFHHPTFLYESLWNLVGLILLMVLRRQKFLRSGELFASYFIWYSIGRFFIEALRTDSLAFQGAAWLASFVNGLWSPMTWLGFEQGYLAPSYGNVRISQLLAIGIVIAAIIFIIVRRRTVRDLPYYSDPITSTKVVAAEALPGTAEAAEPEKAESVKPAETTVEELPEVPEEKKE
ncbi:prolipoprotein diacylglyceryl transferase [Paenibacillus timonensis]|jgi:phosphatidylglycerol---prolipoprotein diacylglyceryl transferase|uniref:Phosphatidylglycerol--prolipoprotein diacylglyceryl transferase n=1 Tax=Paenibacillus timonensis TaxID=225915 RepID=A0ABW3SGD4_9BACL|nr:prolipoprotein diacylglyceryl transferase [Paenibacillus timonensis]MCH1641865.1 prolipoprotein diacylglyceryl transferase [Paenibacillus timonensis]GJM80643.1 prolipoprotein diacylglyceryl transferase [Paenibacillus sp. HMSSN-139]